MEKVVGVDKDEEDLSSDMIDSNEDGGSESPVGSLAFTLGPNN
jgi:hypothetical protein